MDEPYDQVKYGADGQVDIKLKARYAVAKGYAQFEGLDFFDTYPPTSKPETFRILQATAAQKDPLHSFQYRSRNSSEAARGFVKKANSGQKLV